MEANKSPPPPSFPPPPFPSQSPLISPPTTSSRRVRVEQNAYRHRHSRLDLHGELVRPWASSDRLNHLVDNIERPQPQNSENRKQGTPQQQEQQHQQQQQEQQQHDPKAAGDDPGGWYNLTIVVLFTYVVSNAIYASYNSTPPAGFSFPSSPFSASAYVLHLLSLVFVDRGAAAIAMFMRLPALFRDWGILILAYFTLTYGIQWVQSSPFSWTSSSSSSSITSSLVVPSSSSSPSSSPSSAAPPVKEGCPTPLDEETTYAHRSIIHTPRPSPKTTAITTSTTTGVRKEVIVLQILAECGLFIGPILYTRYSSNCADWPLTQKLAFLMEATVLTMKMHSYVVVNRHLQREVAMGGSGMGENVYVESSNYNKRAGMMTSLSSSNLDTSGEAEMMRTPPAASSSQLHLRRRPQQRTRSASNVPVSSSSVPVDVVDSADSSSVSSSSSTTTSNTTSTQSDDHINSSIGEGIARTTRRNMPHHTSSSTTVQRPFSSVSCMDILCRLLKRITSAFHAHIRSEIGISKIEAAKVSKGMVSGASMNIFPAEIGEEEENRIRARAAQVVARSSGGRVASTTTEEDAAPLLASAESAAASSTIGTSTTTPTPTPTTTTTTTSPTLLSAVPTALDRTNLSPEVSLSSIAQRITTLAHRRYPSNVSLKDLVFFTVAPTLCYEPNYPRTKSIDIGYIFEKMFLAGGLVTAGVYVYANYMRPVLTIAHEIPFLDAVSRLMLPTVSTTLIIFFVVFECILNFAAEISKFGDRSFYSAWYNSTSYTEFSRKWNSPVHEWLLRHVYLDTMRRQGLSPTAALYLTYLVSIAAHELVIFGGLGVVFPYLAIFSTTQFPLMFLLRLPIFKGKRLGNMFFWAGLMIGLTMILVLYARDFNLKTMETASMMMTSNTE